MKLDRKTEEAEATVRNMLELLDDSGTRRDGEDPLKGMNPRLRKKFIADKKKRERALLQRKMAAGVDFLGDHDVRFQGVRKE